MDNAFNYIKANGGIDTEKSYPYVEIVRRKCRFSKENVGATVKGYVDVRSGDENALVNAVATVSTFPADRIYGYIELLCFSLQ